MNRREARYLKQVSELCRLPDEWTAPPDRYPIWGFLLGRTRPPNPDLAAVLTEVTFDHAMEAFPRYDDQVSSVRAWTFGVAKRVWFNWVKEFKRMEARTTRLEQAFGVTTSQGAVLEVGDFQRRASRLSGGHERERVWITVPRDPRLFVERPAFDNLTQDERAQARHRLANEWLLSQAAKDLDPLDRYVFKMSMAGCTSAQAYQVLQVACQVFGDVPPSYAMFRQRKSRLPAKVARSFK